MNKSCFDNLKVGDIIVCEHYPSEVDRRFSVVGYHGSSSYPLIRRVFSGSYGVSFVLPKFTDLGHTIVRIIKKKKEAVNAQ